MEESRDFGSKFGSSISIGEHSFSQMEDDIDRQKLLGTPSNLRIQPVSEFDHLTLQVQVYASFSLNLMAPPFNFADSNRPRRGASIVFRYLHLCRPCMIHVSTR